MTLHRAVVAGLLCVSERRALERRVETLEVSRQAVLDVEASELHRIERDLHDGAQQRLVALTIDLGLAAERVDADPATGKRLIPTARARPARRSPRSATSSAASPRRSSWIEGSSRRSVDHRSRARCHDPRERLADRRAPAAAVERAAYFVVTEALANVAKHSGATRCEVRCRLETGRLVVEVWDDGGGGAMLEPGGGLAGLESRLAGVDGILTVTSPPAARRWFGRIPPAVRHPVPSCRVRSRGRPAPPGPGDGRRASPAG